MIEVISGRPLGVFLRERLFEPLGMVDTGFGVPPEKRARARRDVRTSRRDHRARRGQRTRGLAQGLQRTPRRVARPTRSTRPRPSCAAAMACSARSATISGSPRCWPTAASSTASASSAARRSSSCTRTTCRRHSCRSRSAACPCSATASASARGCPGRGAIRGAGLGRRVRLVGRRQDALLGRPKEELVGLFMTQSMMSFDLPELDLRALAYQAIED